MSSNVIPLHASSSLPDTFPHGGAIEAAAVAWQCDVADVLDLSTGLHPQGSPDWLKGWMAEHAELAGHYPDVGGEPARSVLAKEFDVDPKNVLIVAGAQAVIEVIFQAMGWQSMAIRVPCYNEPIRCAKRAGCEVAAIENGDCFPDVDAYWHTSPSNPFGHVEDFPEHMTGVLDESYMTFSKRRKMGVKQDVIRLGSLTKTFCIPGLRLGYVIADAELINRLKAWLPPWPASTLALHLLPKLLPEADSRDVQIKESRERLMKLLKKHQWEHYSSEASFMLAKPPATMPDFAQHKILVREFPEWSQLEGWARFGFPDSEEEWQRLELTIRGVL